MGNEVYDTSKTTLSDIDCIGGIELLYPVNDNKNAKLYEHYKTLANSIDNVHFGGPLAEYKYYDPASTMQAAMRLWERVR